MKRVLVIALLVFLISPATLLAGGKIVVSNDEWPLSVLGYSSSAPEADQFAKNVATYFANGQPGTFHTYSNNLAFDSDQLAATMRNAGHAWTRRLGIPFDLPTLSNYDGIFLAGNYVDNQVLTDYVNAGGDVYIAAGTGGGPEQEAAAWNPFLNQFGLAIDDEHNAVGAGGGRVISITSSHPLFAGVPHLYHNNGVDVFDLSPADPLNQVIATSDSHGLFAIYDGPDDIPLQQSALLFRERLDSDKEGTWGFFGDGIPGFDHSALSFRGQVHESHPSNVPQGLEFQDYYDPDTASTVRVFPDSGVQQVHTVGSFRHDSSDPNTTVVTAYLEIPIADDLASSMRDAINTVLDAEFQFINLSSREGIRATLSPEAQKGGNGTFTCVGLIEWAAETAGHNEGQGFIPNDMEKVIELDTLEQTIPTLSPWLLSKVAQGDGTPIIDWIIGTFDPVDFILTDPLGRRFGFTEAMGLINEIPGMQYTGDGRLEQFLLLNPLRGEYDLELIGKDEIVFGGLATKSTARMFDMFAATSESFLFHGVVVAVPEPSSTELCSIICGLMVIFGNDRLFRNASGQRVPE